MNALNPWEDSRHMIPLGTRHTIA